jgi:hypothetical protein
MKLVLQILRKLQTGFCCQGGVERHSWDTVPRNLKQPVGSRSLLPHPLAGDPQVASQMVCVAVQVCRGRYRAETMTTGPESICIFDVLVAYVPAY